MSKGKIALAIIASLVFTNSIVFTAINGNPYDYSTSALAMHIQKTDWYILTKS